MPVRLFTDAERERLNRFPRGDREHTRTDHLREIVERLVATTRERAQNETYRRLTSLLTPALRDRLDAVLPAPRWHRPNFLRACATRAG